MSQSNKKPQKQQQLQIELGEKEAQGIYSNMAVITHSPAEFVIDFTRVVPGVQKAKVQTRVITTPQHAKMLMRALEENIEKFESRFGEIKMPGGMPNPSYGFAPNTEEEKVN